MGITDSSFWKMEVQIQSCFSSPVKFHYPNSVDDSENLIEQFKNSRESTVDDAVLF